MMCCLLRATSKAKGTPHTRGGQEDIVCMCIELLSICFSNAHLIKMVNKCCVQWHNDTL